MPSNSTLLHFVLVAAATLACAAAGCGGDDGRAEKDTHRSTTPAPLDLKLTMSASPPAPCPVYMNGDEISIQIQVENLGDQAATGVEVRTPLPEGLVFTGSSDPSRYDDATGMWRVGDVAGREIKQLRIEALLDSPLHATTSMVTVIDSAAITRVAPADANRRNDVATAQVSSTPARGVIDVEALAPGGGDSPATVRYWLTSFGESDASTPVEMAPAGQVDCGAAASHRRFATTLQMTAAGEPYTIEVTCAGRTGRKEDVTVCPSYNPDVCFRFGSESVTADPCQRCADVVVP